MTKRSQIVLVILVSCGSPSATPSVEIAQPLPSPTQPPVALPVQTSASVRDSEEPDAARDPRRNRAGVRARTLVTTETQGLEQLLAVTAQTSPDRPQLLRRIAEDYVELRKDGSPVASRKAIERYTTLMGEYPAYPLLDEVLYYLALEDEVAGDFAAARRTYYELIKSRPSSSFVPYAYYAFGELFLKEATSDPSKWEFAQQAYTETLKFSSSAIAPDAMFKLVLVFQGMGDGARAQQMKTRLLRDYPSSSAAARAAP